MPRPMLNPELRVKTSAPLSLGELPTALGIEIKPARKATVPIDPPSKHHPLTTTEATATAIAKSYEYRGEGDIDDDAIPAIAYKSHAGGRPSKYTKAHPRIVFEFALLGLSDERIAAAMQIDVTTFYVWGKEYPEFSQALVDGRENVDREVANAMFRRATGFKYRTVKIMPNKADPERPIYAEYEEYMPPDVNAAKYWLGIRRGKMRKDGWAEAPENTDGGSAPPAVSITINVRDPQEAAKQYREMMQLEGVAE